MKENYKQTNMHWKVFFFVYSLNFFFFWQILTYLDKIDIGHRNIILNVQSLSQYHHRYSRLTQKDSQLQKRKSFNQTEHEHIKYSFKKKA